MSAAAPPPLRGKAAVAEEPLVVGTHEEEWALPATWRIGAEEDDS